MRSQYHTGLIYLLFLSVRENRVTETGRDRKERQRSDRQEDRKRHKERQREKGDREKQKDRKRENRDRNKDS